MTRVSTPLSFSQPSRLVPVKLPGIVFSITAARLRTSTSPFSRQPGVPFRNEFASWLSVPCWTTTIGMPASAAPSIASVIRRSELGGCVIGRDPPGKYSFCTSITKSARFTTCVVHDSAGASPGRALRHHLSMGVITGSLARLIAGPLQHHPVFGRLLATQGTLSFGQQLSALALPTVAILFLNAGPMEVGILAALPWVSSPLLGPVAGTLIDRFPRRPVMVAADTGRFLCMLAIAIALLAGGLTLYQLYVIAFLYGCLGLCFDVAFQANMPATFTDRDLLEANSRLELARSPALVGGAALAGFVISGVGPARGLFGTALTFLFSAINIAGIKAVEAPPARREARETVLRQMLGGMAMVARNPILRSIETATDV